MAKAPVVVPSDVVDVLEPQSDAAIGEAPIASFVGTFTLENGDSFELAYTFPGLSGNTLASRMDKAHIGQRILAALQNDFGIYCVKLK